MAKDYVLEKRKYVIGGVALAIVLIYLLRLFSLQIASVPVTWGNVRPE